MSSPVGTPGAITFETIWDGELPPPAEITELLPAVDAAGPDDRQVVFAVRAPGDSPRAADAPSVSLDALAGKPWIESVLLLWPAVATVPLPQLRSVFSLYRGGRVDLDAASLAYMPNLEQLIVGRVLAEDLLPLTRLRDLSFDWKSVDVPPDVRHLDLINTPGSLDRFRIETAGAAVLAQLPKLERLAIPSFHWRDPADPLADLVGLRWLSLHGWRNLRALGSLTELERLEVVEFDKMANLRAYRRLAKLHTLRLMGSMNSLEGIQALEALESLWLRGRVARDLGPLAALPKLDDLSLIYPDAVDDFAPIGALKGLRRFELLLGNITDAGALPSIGFLSGLDNLEEVELRNVAIGDNRLDALYELPNLRRVVLTGRAGPDVEELRRRRPEVEVETWLHGDPEGRIRVGPIHCDPPAPGIDHWTIYQDVTPILGTPTNDDAERRVRAHLRRHDPALLKRLEFDSESGAIGIYASSEADIRAAADAIVALSAAS